jgi:glycosyltransferase involved in cell wall biosynthesis
MASGIADYSYELLPAIAERASVEVVCPRPGLLARPKVPPGIPVVSPAAFSSRVDSYDVVFCHLGNNSFHRFVYRLAMESPGICVLHDFVMHHLIAHMTIWSRWAPDRYLDLMEAEYGQRGRRLGELQLLGAGGRLEKFLFPLNEHIARRAKGIVVHSEDSARRLREVAPGVPAWVIPHHGGRSPSEVRGIGRHRARSMLNLPESAFLVGHFGFLTWTKQPAAVLEGFRRLAARRDDAMLLVVGADRVPGGLHRLIRQYRLQDRIRITGFVDLRRFYLYLKAVDAVVNLRYPTAGESSGTFARALAEGRAVIVNNIGSFAEVPGDVALKVDVDGDQAADLAAHLIRLADDPAFRDAVDERAHQYAVSLLDPRRCARLYLEVAAASGQWRGDQLEGVLG